jgi:polyhydroxyalkanoate synthesis regulator phasin
MAFFDNIGKKVGDVAQSAAKKSGELIEINKLNSNIGNEEDSIKSLYNEIGKLVYQRYLQDMLDNEEYRSSCENIKGHQENISALKAKIEDIKNS